MTTGKKTYGRDTTREEAQRLMEHLKREHRDVTDALNLTKIDQLSIKYRDQLLSFEDRKRIVNDLANEVRADNIDRTRRRTAREIIKQRQRATAPITIKHNTKGE